MGRTGANEDEDVQESGDAEGSMTRAGAEAVGMTGGVIGAGAGSETAGE